MELRKQVKRYMILLNVLRNIWTRLNMSETIIRDSLLTRAYTYIVQLMKRLFYKVLEIAPCLNRTILT